jgi:dynein assembly factor 2
MEIVYLFSGGSGSSRKSVRFSEVVHRQVFRSNSSILGQKMKNTKKAEQKKRRAIERRASEGDAEHFSSSSGDDFTLYMFSSQLLRG